eukprot:gene4218-5282_t
MKPTVTYFNGRGRAELIRLILAYNSVEFVDIKLPQGISEELRPTLPYGSLPVYQDDDVYLAQSITIARYLANKYNIAGTTPAERAKADELVDTLGDVFLQMYTKARESEAGRKDFVEITIPRFVGAWEKLLSTRKYTVTDKIIWSDIAIAFAYEYLEHQGYAEDLKGKFPKVLALKDEIFAIPSIQEYTKTRTESKF